MASKLEKLLGENNISHNTAAASREAPARELLGGGVGGGKNSQTHENLTAKTAKTPTEAEAYVRGFYALYPRTKQDHDDVLRALKKGPVNRATMTGRRRDGITSRNEAINAPVQGTAADVLKAAMGLVHERLEPFGGSAFVAGCFHDELLVECEIGDAVAVLAALEGAMVEALEEARKSPQADAEGPEGHTRNPPSPKRPRRARSPAQSEAGGVGGSADEDRRPA